MTEMALCESQGDTVCTQNIRDQDAVLFAA